MANRDQTATTLVGSSPTSLALTWATLPTAGAKALVVIGLAGSGTITSVVDNGTTPRTFTAEGNNGGNIYLYRADNITLPASGSYKVTITITGASGTDYSAGGRTYTAMATGGPSSSNFTASGLSTAVNTGNLTPPAVGSLKFGAFVDDTGTTQTQTLTTSGANVVYAQTSGSAGFAGGAADHITTAGGAQSLAWTLSASQNWATVYAVYASGGATTFHPTASLDGSGTLSASRTRSGAASLTGSGTVTPSASRVRPQSVLLTGSGTVTVAGTPLVKGGPSAVLSGSGSLTAARRMTFGRTVSLTGSGSVSALKTGVRNRFVSLDGSGTVTPARTLIRRRTAALDGTGAVSVLQVTGGLVSGTGGVAAPVALPGASQVAVAPPGTLNWQWIGTLGHVVALKYSFVCPGGPDKMTCTVQVPASYRTQLFNPGWQVKITRGAHQVWYGKLDDAQPSQSGWTLTAVGAGNQAQDFQAYYTDTWPNGEPDEILNNAIGRGLNWVNPGLNASPYAGQFWFGQALDPATATVAQLMNLITGRGGLLWYVNSQPGGLIGNSVTLFPLPTVPNRILVSTSPVGRTLGGDVNTIFIRYQSVADDSANGTAAAYGTVIAQNAASVAAHGVMETNMDLSDAGVMTSAAAQAVGNQVLSIYKRASFGGAFTGSYGQLLNTGGSPIDPGTDQAGTMVRLILTDFGYGGEVAPGPINFITGAYEWDDYAQVFTLSAFQTVDQSLSGLIQLQGMLMKPLTSDGG